MVFFGVQKGKSMVSSDCYPDRETGLCRGGQDRGVLITV